VLALAVLGLAAAPAAGANPIRFDPDSLPIKRGRMVHIDFNPTKRIRQSQTPNSIAFLLPAHWTFDHRAVKRECTPAEAAAVHCPHVSRVGFGHVVTHVAGYLFPGGGTDSVSYLTAFLGPPSAPGDLGSLVIEAQLLGANPVIAALNKFTGTKTPRKSSVTGRIRAIHGGRYGLDVTFAGFPGGLTIPPLLALAGVTAAVHRFKLEVGAVRRVKRPFVHRIPIETLNGPSVEIVHDHHLVPFHMLTRPKACPASGAWPWQIRLGFPSGPANITGTTRCH
jgi:hypothetical protein